MPQRRSQNRLLDAELAMICWQERGTKLMSMCNVNDLSAGGIGVVMDDALPLGTPVVITYGDGELTGIVKHHVAGVDGYFVGMEFDGNSKDSDLHFRPELLISIP